MAYYTSDTNALCNPGEGALSLKCQKRIEIRKENGLTMLVPCRHCVNCSVRRQLAWSLRISLESGQHEFNSFLTLTYEDKERADALDYKDIQLFLKRLRKSTRGSVRFFCCGEYGARTQRGHWHIAIFGAQPSNMGLQLIRQWPHGHAHVGEVNMKTAQYVARYALKSGRKGHLYQVQMSRRPGLGLPKIREMGRYLCSVTPEIEHTPYWFRYGKRLLPLDESGRRSFEEAYTASGGLVENCTRSPLALDMESRLLAITGDPFAEEVEGVSLTKLDEKELSSVL